MWPWGHPCQLLGKGAGREEAASPCDCHPCCLAPWVNSRLAGLALAPFLLCDWQQLSNKQPRRSANILPWNISGLSQKMTSCLPISSSIDLTWVYWVALGFWSPPSYSLLKDANTPGGTPRECTATATPTPQLPHWHTTALSGKQSHMCSIVCSQHPLPLRAFTPGTITPLSHYRAALPRDHPRTEGSHTGDTTLDPSPAAHTEPSPGVPSCGHVDHNAQATQSITPGHQSSFAIP